MCVVVMLYMGALTGVLTYVPESASPAAALKSRNDFIALCLDFSLPSSLSVFARSLESEGAPLPVSLASLLHVAPVTA